jgi:hypothetical protein
LEWIDRGKRAGDFYKLLVEYTANISFQTWWDSVCTTRKHLEREGKEYAVEDKNVKEITSPYLYQNDRFQKILEDDGNAAKMVPTVEKCQKLESLTLQLNGTQKKVHTIQKHQRSYAAYAQPMLTSNVGTNVGNVGDNVGDDQPTSDSDVSDASDVSENPEGSDDPEGSDQPSGSDAYDSNQRIMFQGREVELCRKWGQGTCKKGDKCIYLHSGKAGSNKKRKGMSDKEGRGYRDSPRPKRGKSSGRY